MAFYLPFQLCPLICSVLTRKGRERETLSVHNMRLRRRILLETEKSFSRFF